METIEMNTPNENWSLLVSTYDGISEDPAKQVRILSDFQTWSRLGEFESIDRILTAATPGNLSELTLLILLRGSFAFREKLPTWTSLRDEAAAELTLRGVDVTKSLRGLFEVGHPLHTGTARTSPCP
jgi:hypothetical protein